MLIRYRGGRVMYEITFNRIPYYFNAENNYILDVRDQTVVNYIFSLPNRGEFEAVVEEIKQPKIEKIETKEPEIIKKSGRPKKEKK